MLKTGKSLRDRQQFERSLTKTPKEITITGFHKVLQPWNKIEWKISCLMDKPMLLPCPLQVANQQRVLTSKSIMITFHKCIRSDFTRICKSRQPQMLYFIDQKFSTNLRRQRKFPTKAPFWNIWSDVYYMVPSDIIFFQVNSSWAKTFGTYWTKIIFLLGWHLARRGHTISHILIKLSQYLLLPLHSNQFFSFLFSNQLTSENPFIIVVCQSITQTTK